MSENEMWNAEDCRVRITVGMMAGKEGKVLSESTADEAMWVVKLDGFEMSYQYWSDEFEVLSGSLAEKAAPEPPHWVGDHRGMSVDVIELF